MRNQDYMFSNRMYDVLKALVQIGLPAAGTLYFTLAQIWGLPRADEVVGSLAAIATFLGVLLAIATRSYNSSESKYGGTIVVDDDPSDAETPAKFSLDVSSNPFDWPHQKQITFRIQK